ncbi:MAG: hypothetical protein K2L88_02425 [Clostridiales bacterium]|nr:hypothetical protein [Clostridiales bacterium]
MEKSEKFRLIYSIFLGVFTVAVGIAIICVAADIYYSGKGTEVIYSRAIVGERLTALAIPIILLIAAVIFGAIFPLYKVKASRPPEVTLGKLSARIPQSGDGEEFTTAQAAYKKANIIRLVAWLVALAVVLASAIAVLCYIVNTKHFAGDITEDIFAMTANILPWLAAAFAACIAATVVSGVFANKQISAAKTMIKNGDKASVAQKTEPAFITKVKNIIAKPAFLWAVRGAVFVIAVVFIIVGIVNGGAHDVLIKAINICTECIGLG